MRKLDDKIVRVPVLLTERLVAQLDAIAVREGLMCSRSAMMRRAVADFVRRELQVDVHEQEAA